MSLRKAHYFKKLNVLAAFLIALFSENNIKPANRQF